MKRTFNIDVLICEQCDSKMHLISVVDDAFCMHDTTKVKGEHFYHEFSMGLMVYLQKLITCAVIQNLVRLMEKETDVLLFTSPRSRQHVCRLKRFVENAGKPVGWLYAGG